MPRVVADRRRCRSRKAGIRRSRQHDRGVPYRTPHRGTPLRCLRRATQSGSSPLSPVAKKTEKVSSYQSTWPSYRATEDVTTAEYLDAVAAPVCRDRDGEHHPLSRDCGAAPNRAVRFWDRTRAVPGRVDRCRVNRSGLWGVIGVRRDGERHTLNRYLRWRVWCVTAIRVRGCRFGGVALDDDLEPRQRLTHVRFEVGFAVLHAHHEATDILDQSAETTIPLTG